MITVARSSTTSHPTAMRPSGPERMPLTSRALRSTTVDAQESESPSAKASTQWRPKITCAATAPSAVAPSICRIAPGIAIFFTRIRS